LNKTFLNDVLKGLSDTPQKTLPSKYFYDARGDELFQQIMAMPEYYLTRAEMDIFQHKTDAIISALKLDKTLRYDLIELGPGDGTKTIHLLEGLLQMGHNFSYLPIDISQNALDGLTNMLNTALPNLDLVPQQGDYFVKLKGLQANTHPKIILVLGSNIGNLPDADASEFIYQLGANLKPGDKVLLGVDLIKAKSIILPAYSDAKGITAEFNLNLLDRINSELGGNFDRSCFEHLACYDEADGIAKSYLVSKTKQNVSIHGQTFHFDEGERIHTEISRKYNDIIISEILQPTDIRVETKITDSQNLFADYILVRE
jgi:dimethylhistidine N-methyltransferase